MGDNIVRIQEIELNNFKNVGKGSVAFNGYNNLKKNIEPDLADIIGVYGQNGSGKTALIDSLQLLKEVIIGNPLGDNISNLITYKQDSATLKYTFLINIDKKKYLLYYSFSFRVVKESKVIIDQEKLEYSEFLENKWKRKKALIEYDYRNEESFFKPKYQYDEFVKKDKENITNLKVMRTLSYKMSTSFIFNEDTLELLKNNLDGCYLKVIESLIHFIRFNLFVIKNDHLGVISTNQLMPFSFRLESEKELIAGGMAIKLFGISTIRKHDFEILSRIFNQINIVLNSIIPNLQIKLMNHGEETLENGELGVKVEIFSVRDTVQIPLKYESDGIKKIISILSALIAMYNDSSICIAVDELDAGIFEYLLGELLEILEIHAKGQFIFTSHNLRALEKLHKESVVFTTTNVDNRYIKLSNVKNNNNLRDFYLRGIVLGGQKEPIYCSTNSYEISYAFRKAWEKSNEC